MKPLVWIAVLAALVGAWLAPRPARADDPVQVHAASSLTDVVTEIARRFETATGGPAPVLSFAGSSTLVHQIEHGAPADVVVTADAAWMDYLQAQGLVDASTRVQLADNRLVVVVPRTRTFVLTTLADLASPEISKIAVAAEPVPAGKRAREALVSVGLGAEVTDKFIVARNVRGALALCARDQVDAALVYRSDAWASDEVTIAFEVPSQAHLPIVYPAALTSGGSASDSARAFIAFLQGPEARAVFADAGFDPTTAHQEQAGDPAWRNPAVDARGTGDAVRLSLWVAALSLCLSLVPAIVLGWLLARRDFVGKSLVSTLLLTPLVLPPVVVGFVLLETFGRGGPLSPVLGALGVEVAFTQFGAVVAAAVVGFPLLVLLSRLAIESVDVRYEQVAQTLGLTPLAAFFRITLPMALPGLAAGCVLAYARALGEFGATAVLASDIPGHTRTLALAIFALYEQPGRQTEAHTLVWISIALCAVALVAYEWLGRVQKRRLSA